MGVDEGDTEIDAATRFCRVARRLNGWKISGRNSAENVQEGAVKPFVKLAFANKAFTVSTPSS